MSDYLKPPISGNELNKKNLKLPLTVGLLAVIAPTVASILCGVGIYAQEFSVETHGSPSHGIVFIQGDTCSATVWNFPNMRNPSDTFGDAQRHISYQCVTPFGEVGFSVEQNIDGSVEIK